MKAKLSNSKRVPNRARSAGSHERLVRHTVAARVASMQSEKLYLQNLHGELGRQWRGIGERIEALDRQIAAEKASVPNEQRSAMTPPETPDCNHDAPASFAAPHGSAAGWIRDNRERKTREWYDTKGRLCLWMIAEALPTHRNPDEPAFGHYPDAKPPNNS